MSDGWQEEVLGLWFGELRPEDWWSSDRQVDQKVRRFAGLHAELASQDPAQLATTPRGSLAAIIVLDQFPRNIFRGQAEAFATDARALAVTQAAIRKAFDLQLSAAERQFLYMPLMHSERLADQERSVELFERLGVVANAQFAREHRDIIARFGRFPHRNRVLNRASTEVELAFLTKHKGFGQ